MLRLHVVRATDAGPGPRLDALDGRRIDEWFKQATGGALAMKIVDHQTDIDTSACTAATLQEIVQEALPEPRQRPVSDIAVIFCRQWAGLGSLYGLMFDYDGTDPKLGTFSSGGVPRQACAVFLAEFDPETDDKQVWTATHELGHVFNLQHDPAAESFMGTDGWQNGFNGGDCERLSLAANGNWNYAPGGDNFSAGREPTLVRPEGTRADRKRWELRARLGKQSYMAGESIVLELRLRPKGRKMRRCMPWLDPGYPALSVWFETPLGERRLHRPPTYFCTAGQKPVDVVVQRPLENNPRIALGNRGLNFATPGVYRLWVEFLAGEPGAACLVRSRDLKFEIRSPQSDAENKIVSVLSRPAVAFFVANKGGRLTRRNRREVEDLARSHHNHSAVQHLRYALGADYVASGRAAHAREFLRRLRVPEASIARGVERLLKRGCRPRGTPHVRIRHVGS